MIGTHEEPMFLSPLAEQLVVLSQASCATAFSSSVATTSAVTRSSTAPSAFTRSSTASGLNYHEHTFLGQCVTR